MLSEHYKAYLRELQGVETLESDAGFATYLIKPGDHCYIQDVYVAPDFRGENLAYAFADQICARAIAAGCKRLYGSVDSTLEACHVRMKMLLGYGLKLSHVQGQMVFFVKELTP